jgi:hypothetical protein
MILIKKANILQIILLLVLSSCKQKNTPEVKAVLKKPIETTLIIQQGPKLTPAYINQKEFHNYYYNKTWPRGK